MVVITGYPKTATKQPLRGKNVTNVQYYVLYLIKMNKCVVLHFSTHKNLCNEVSLGGNVFRRRPSTSAFIALYTILDENRPEKLSYSIISVLSFIISHDLYTEKNNSSA